MTDPPFFDNVHYSELADFFFAWQQLCPSPFVGKRTTTRHAEEVQDTSPEQFASKLRAVFGECCRVLREDGLLVFTYQPVQERPKVVAAEVTRRIFKANSRLFSASSRRRLLIDGRLCAGLFHDRAQDDVSL